MPSYKETAIKSVHRHYGLPRPEQHTHTKASNL